MGIKGFKVFNSDWTCRGFQYKVGETFKHNGNIELCGQGFHFCKIASNCFNYYSFNSNNKVAEVEAIGLCEGGDDKLVTNELKILREITWQELLTIVNTGKDCTGLSNTGNYNTGDCNTGSRNTGNYNTGNYNTGDCNTGSRNTGNYNTGNCNTGNWNTGNCNTGNYNTGDCNIINNSSNIFSTVEENIKIFDKPSNLTLQDWKKSRARDIIMWNTETTAWIYASNMTDEEKLNNPNYKTTGGYLKSFTYKESWKNMWNVITEEEKQEIMNIPNFDKEKFLLITGIEI